MSKCFLVCLSCLLWSCSGSGTNHNGGTIYTVPGEDTAGRNEDAKDKSGRQPLNVAIITVGDIARDFGVDPRYVILASAACLRHMDCLRDAGKPYVEDYQCEDGLLATWCPPGACPEKREKDDSCYELIRGLSCDELDQVLECPWLRNQGHEFRVTDWPQGEVPAALTPEEWIEQRNQKATNRR